MQRVSVVEHTAGQVSTHVDTLVSVLLSAAGLAEAEVDTTDETDGRVLGHVAAHGTRLAAVCLEDLVVLVRQL